MGPRNSNHGACWEIDATKCKVSGETSFFTDLEQLVLVYEQLKPGVSGVSGGKEGRWKRKREKAEGAKHLTQMLLLEPSTPTQLDSIPSNQNLFRSLGCQLQKAHLK